MDSQSFLFILFVIFAVLAAGITLLTFVYPTFAKIRKMDSQEKRTSTGSQNSATNDSSKRNRLKALQFQH